MSNKLLQVPDLLKILAYQNNAVVSRISEEMEIAYEKAELLFKDCLTFLWLSELADRPIAPSPKIDEAWHTFLLFTEDYQGFCQTYFGKFKHHRPRRPEDPADNGEIYHRTIGVINTHLGGLKKLSENWVYRQQSCVSCDTPSTNCQDPKCS